MLLLICIGMIHAALGPTYVNTFLSAVNVSLLPAIIFQKCKNEVGVVMGKVAKNSCNEVTTTERSMVVKVEFITDNQL